jgi:hypothetical protein
VRVMQAQRLTNGAGDIGPSGQRWRAKGRGGNEAAVASGADRWDQQHSAAGAVLNRFKKVQTDSILLKL